jgi:hypothetical protein
MVCSVRRGHWLGWALAFSCMVVTTVGALALPAAHGPDGSRSLHEVFVFDAPDSRDGLSRVAEAYMLPGSIFLLTFLLLVAGVAGRRRWSRFVAAAPAGLALLVLGIVSFVFLFVHESYNSAETVALQRRIGVELLVLAVLVVVATGFLLAGRRTVYDRFVVTGLVVLAVWHLVAILTLRSVPELEFRFTQLALLLTPAYLFAAFWTAVASLRR